MRDEAQTTPHLRYIHVGISGVTTDQREDGIIIVGILKGSTDGIITMVVTDGIRDITTGGIIRDIQDGIMGGITPVGKWNRRNRPKLFELLRVRRRRMHAMHLLS
jgi:hypothetical protein